MPPNRSSAAPSSRPADVTKRSTHSAASSPAAICEIGALLVARGSRRDAHQ